MSALSVSSPYPIFTDTDGSPLENGYIWIGTVNLPAQTNPIAVYWDAALTIPATQPIRTQGGYPSRNGSPARLYVNSDYSILVQNKNGSMVYSAPAATERISGDVISTLNASQVVYDPAGSGAVPTTVQAKLRETVSVLDFGAVGDGVTDDTAAIQAAIDYAHNTGNNKVVEFPASRYLITSTINLHWGSKIKGENIDASGTAGATSFPLQLSDSRGTVILFQPTTQQSLFKPVLPKGGSSAWSGIGIDGFNIWGNTSKPEYYRVLFGEGAAVETSLYAIDFDDVQISSVRNVAVTGFMSAIRESNRCQNNNYENIYIQYCRGAAIEYSQSTTGVEVTDTVYSNTRVWSCQHGLEIVNTSGNADPLQLRFHHCFFAAIVSHCFVIASGCREITFVDTYVEGVGVDITIPNVACFLIGTGTAPQQTIPNVTILGGQFAGSTGGFTHPSNIFISTDVCGGVNVITADAKRFVNGIVCTANTRDKSIYLSNPFFDVVTGALFGASTNNKIVGIYRTVRSDGGNNAVQLKIDNIVSDTLVQITPAVGSNIRLGDGGTTGIVQPGNTSMKLGDSTYKWDSVYFNPVAVASLPAAVTARKGARHFVSDATATTFASVVAGGGANAVPVYCDGANWRIG